MLLLLSGDRLLRELRRLVRRVRVAGLDDSDRPRSGADQVPNDRTRSGAGHVLSERPRPGAGRLLSVRCVADLPHPQVRTQLQSHDLSCETRVGACRV